MLLTGHKAMQQWMRRLAAFTVVAGLGGWFCVAQTATVPQAGAVPPPSSATTAAGEQGTVLDRVIAIVNGDVILESDVDEERRFQAIQPYRDPVQDLSRDRAVQRLIDRMLIVQEAALEPEPPISDAELDTELMELRKEIPACKEYHCETEAGWEKYLADHGFTLEEFRDRWRQRMEVLRFIEVRFRNGIHISDDEIKQYYEKTLLPQYAKQNVTPPPVATISKRVEEVLLQQQVGNLLQDWLKTLRAQGNVRLIRLGEVAQ
jgi:parvulin-like peptidyl-prolyl isomerase